MRPRGWSGEPKRFRNSSACRGLQVRPLGHGDPFEKNLGADPRAVEDVPQVGGQSVREVHHGVHLPAHAEPEPLLHLRARVAVLDGRRGVEPPGKQVAQTGSRGAERPCGEEHVARVCRTAALDARQGGPADGRHVDRDALPGAGRVAAHECHAVALRQGAVALHELLGPRLARIGREGQREQRGHGASAHRGDVAQIDGQRLAAQLAGRGGAAQEVYSATGSTAQSSPMPSNPLSGSFAKRAHILSMNPNSVIVA